MALFSGRTNDKPPAPPGPPAAPVPAPSRPAPNVKGGKTVIGSQVKVVGEISGDEDIEVLGRVEGSILLKKDLVISGAGSVDAKIHAKNVTIAGKVKGDVTADERVELLASGSLEGNIKAPKIVISEGAHFRGNVDMSSRPEGGRPNEPGKPAAPSALLIEKR
jgi:cytoskeletal protein CcmA (bactofilin family)